MEFDSGIRLETLILSASDILSMKNQTFEYLRK